MIKRSSKIGSGRLFSGALVWITLLAVAFGCAAQKDAESAPADPAAPVEITSINVESSQTQDRVVIEAPQAEGSVPIPYSTYEWTEPSRVVVEFTGAAPGKVPATIPVAKDLIQDVEVKAIPAGQEGVKPKVQVIVNLKHDAEYTAAREGSKVVLTLDKTKGEAAVDMAPEGKSGNVLVADEQGNMTVASSEPSLWEWGGAGAPASSPAPAAAAPAGAPARNLTGIKVENDGEMTRVSFAIDGTLGDYSAFTLEGPDRLVVDLWGIQNQTKEINKDINQQGVARVRLGQHPDKVRLVFDTDGQMPHFRFDKGANRLVVTFSKTVDVSAAPEGAYSVATETAGAPPAAPSSPASSNNEDWPVMVAQNEEWGGVEDSASPAPGPAPADDSLPRSSDVGAWPTPAEAPIVRGPGRPGIAYIDSVKFDYTAEASTISIRADRPLRRDQWEMMNNADKNVSERIITVFIQNAQLAQDQQRTFDTTEFSSPIDIFSVYQIPEKVNEVAVVVVMNSWAASKWNAYDNRLVIQFENYPGSMGIGGQAQAGYKGPMGEDVTGGAEAEKAYSGAVVNLDFKNADILDVLGAIADASGMNIVVSEKVKGRITIKLEGVPWDQALDIILQSRQLAYKQQGNVIRIAPVDEFYQDEMREWNRTINREKMGELEVRIIPVNYLRAQDILRVIQPVLTQGRGRANADLRTNSIVVLDRPEILDKIYAIVKQLDKPTKQVLIEARIVEATMGLTRQIGVQWGTQVDVGPATGTPTGMQFPNTIQVGGATLGGAANAYAGANAASGGGGALGISVGHLTGVVDLDMMLRALEAKEKIKIISSPRIMTVSDEQAVIQQGVSIPYPPPAIIGASAMGWTFVDASLRLVVTPHVASDDSITMDVQASNNEPVTIAGSDQPGVSTKEARTTIMLNNGETAVIGGIFKISQSDPLVQVPYLGNLPIIGPLFQDRIHAERNEELIIFLTPQIVNSGSGEDIEGSFTDIGSGM